jgi:hypothetical protein
MKPQVKSGGPFQMILLSALSTVQQGQSSFRRVAELLSAISIKGGLSFV